ncbi:unnamed protein product [Polarella glacialis]|uniref:Major facilitator superfamily (MFS) profile domain-containing protein n=1 Tax=Polarella glacialis TaxID=89957 RepID=A0A813DZP3_POLGL|nr:unnamed protein product [Polarella glacialis]CAE8606664.1 unnamed protein product [Polarella glacialis]CAE8684943.1 unnamed protein product [Polarella glacialis]
MSCLPRMARASSFQACLPASMSCLPSMARASPSLTATSSTCTIPTVVPAGPVLLGQLASGVSQAVEMNNGTKELAETPRMALVATEEDDNEPMPCAFGNYVLLVTFVKSANYTVVLPTAHNYSASLGGGGWLAGLIVAVAFAPGLLSLPLAPRILRNGYKPGLAAMVLLCAIGNACYGLGQLAGSLWLLVAGQALSGLLWGACGRALAQHVVYACCGKSRRSAWTARNGNIGFLGMGMGPVVAAGLSKVSFKVAALSVDEYTAPGWFFCVVWLLMLLVLPLIPEPERRFETGFVRCTNGEERKCVVWPDGKTLWCLFSVMVCAGTVAVWETSAAIVTQRYFGWSVRSTSLFIGAVFLSSMIGGELVRCLLKRKPSLHELDVTVTGLAMILICSSMLYKYLPSSQSPTHSYEVTYTLGSILVLNAANYSRNYSVAMALRSAASVSGEMKDMAVGAQAAFMMTGRSGGALLGMGLAAMPGGANASAGLVTGISGFCLLLLALPKLHSAIREV